MKKSVMFWRACHLSFAFRLNDDPDLWAGTLALMWKDGIQNNHHGNLLLVSTGLALVSFARGAGEIQRHCGVPHRV